MPRKDVVIIMQSFNDIWANVVNVLSEEYSKNVIDLWFASLKLYELTDSRALIICDMPYKYGIIKTKYVTAIEGALEKAVGFHVEVIILDKTQAPEEYHTYISDNIEAPEPVNLADRVVPPQLCGMADGTGEVDELSETDVYSADASPRKKAASIYNAYTFENFIVGVSNTFAHAASLAVANEPACLETIESSTYNPLFIYGPSGLGKTHLLYAIVNRIKQTRPELKIVYVKGEHFTNELIDSISKKTPEAFREKYRSADVLLIDDIHFIAGREATQEEFFHTFNALHEDNKQIILTSDRPVREIKTLEERLKTRFEWGVCADIQPPDTDLRSAIIKNKAASKNINLSNEVVSFLAENLKSNIRQIEGAIRKLAALYTLTGNQITVDTAKNAIADLISDDEPVTMTVDRIFEKVSKKLGISVEEIKGTRRNREVAYARHISIYLIRKLTNLSLPQIGKILKRDHATVMSSLRTVEKQLGANTQTDSDVSELIKELKS